MRKMLLNQSDMVDRVVEKVTHSGDGDLVFALSGDVFIILHATNLYSDDLEVHVTQELDEYRHLTERMVTAGVMSKEELTRKQRERERVWVLARRARLAEQSVELEARIKRIERIEKREAQEKAR